MVDNVMTAGYDIVAEMKDGFFDRLLAAAFYTTRYMRFQGTMDLSDIAEKPEISAMSEFTKVNYDVRVKEPPTVDTFKDNVVRIIINLDVSLTILGGIWVDLDSAVFADTKITLDHEGIFLDLKNAEVDIVSINDKHKLPKKVINQFNEIIGEVIKKKLLEKYEKIKLPITPYSDKLSSSELPYMPVGKNEVVISIGDPEEDDNGFKLAVNNFKTLNENEIALCMNLMGYDGGDITKISDFSDGLDVCIGLSEGGMRRVFQFWWENTTLPKYKTINGTYSVPLGLLNTLVDIAEFGEELVTLGFAKDKWDIEEIRFNYSATVSINEMPDFDLKGDNKVDFTFKSIRLNAGATLIFRIVSELVVDTSGWFPDWATPWEDDVTISKQTFLKNIDLFNADVGIDVNKAEGKVYLDDRNRLMAKIEDLDINFDLQWDLPEVVLNWIVDFTCKILVDKLPAFPLSSALIAKEIPDLKLTLETDIDKLVINDVEAVIGANLKIKEMARKVFVPKFIANRNPNSLEVHRASCEYIERILEINKVGYYVLIDALEDGYDGCHDCLPEYHNRQHL